MKRSALKRTQGLERSAPLTRAPASLGRSEAPRQASLRLSAPKAGERLPARQLTAAREGWAKGVRSKPCAVCKRKGAGIRVEGHHVVYQAQLRRIAQDHGLPIDRLLWDARNRMPLCAGCHARHHHAIRRVSRERLPPKVFQFVRELDRLYDDREPVSAWLERTYPAHDAADAGRDPA